MGARAWAVGIALSAMSVMAPQAQAQSRSGSIFSGNDLYAACTSTDFGQFNLCLGYLQGVSAGIQTDRMLAKVSRPFCLREQVTLGQLKDVVVTFMQSDPAVRDQYAAGIVEVALIKAFPCSTKP